MPSSNKLFYTIPGLFTELENARTWDYQAQAFLHGRFPQQAAVGFNYSADAIGGTVALSRFAALVGDDLAAARKGRLSTVVVAHSNGCRVALRALELAPEVDNVSLHLLAAACFEDCRWNGLNEAAARGQLTSVRLYVSADDEILGGIFNAILGYGPLGKIGPVNMSPKLAGILHVETAAPGTRHNDWVARDFLNTMERIAYLESA